MFCTSYETTGCGKKICCKECNEADCKERCDNTEECDSMAEKEPKPLNECYEEMVIKVYQ